MWQQVNLAAQALSSSVADALEFCAKNLNLKEFKGCEATVKFLRLFDHLFDVLNSRNPFAKGFKSPIRASNKNSWDSFLSLAYDYILGIKDLSGQEIHTSRKKTGFIGFLAGIKSTRAIFHDLVESPQAPMKYLGGLFKPTASVVKVCEEVERCFDRMLASTDGSLPQCTDGISSLLQALVLFCKQIEACQLQKSLHDCISLIKDSMDEIWNSKTLNNQKNITIGPSTTVTSIVSNF
eukprot:gene9521-10508_t